MHAPQIIVIPFGCRRRFEACDVDAARIDTGKNLANDTILAAGIHRLQHHQHFVFVFGVPYLLQFHRARIQLGKMATVEAFSPPERKLDLVSMSASYVLPFAMIGRMVLMPSDFLVMTGVLYSVKKLTAQSYIRFYTTNRA